MRRRTFLAGTAATIAAAGLGSLRGTLAAELPAGESDLTEAYLELLFENNSEDIKPTGARSRLTGAQYRDVLADLERGEARITFATAELSPDFAHLGAAASSAPFELNAQHLLQYAASNSYKLALNTNPRILFGLRGCNVASTAGEASGTSVALVEAIPDHYTQGCVIGVFNAATGEIAAFNASTVPDAAYIYAQATGLDGANMMPTGLYRYEVGTHGASHRVVETRQPGAWRQSRAWPVRRLRSIPADGVLCYTHAAEWDVGSQCGPLRALTFNNIHAGILDGTNLKVRYSSAGCQTLPGRYSPRPKNPIGAYSRFRIAAGLVADLQLPTVDGQLQTTTAQDGTPFRYMLLTGREARLVATDTGAQGHLRRLRYGSVGAEVHKLQEVLAARGRTCTALDGDMMGMRTVGALVAVQKELGLPADGMVTPELAARLNFGLG